MGGLAPATSEHFNQAADPDEEWEYEYDQHETDDFYFTVDLTTKGRTIQDASGRNTTQRPKSAGQPGGISHHANRPHSAQTPTTESCKGLQVLDLHTNNPLLFLDNVLYSCDWSNELGTQLYATRSDISEPCLKRGHVLDVVGMSRARLTGTPVTLRAKKIESAGASTANAISIDDDEDSVADATDAEHVHNGSEHPPTVLRNAESVPVRAPASFLDRLAAVKQHKGETDGLQHPSMHKYRVPGNANEIRERVLIEEAAQQQAPAISKSNARGSNKRRRTFQLEPNAATPAPKGKKGGPKSNTGVRPSLDLAPCSIPGPSSSTRQPRPLIPKPTQPGLNGAYSSDTVSQPSSPADADAVESQEMQPGPSEATNLEVTVFPSGEAPTYNS